MPTQLHPDVEAFLERRRDEGVLPPHTLSPSDARRRSERLYASDGDVEPVGRVDDVEIRGPDGPLKLRVYVPDGDGPHPVLVWFHGGGFVVGGLDTADATCRALTVEAKRIVVSVEYRLAPEHPFPAAVRDCYRATEWVTANVERFDGLPQTTAVGGASAGGTLAAVTALRSRDRDAPGLQAQVLVYPMTNYDRPMESYEEFADGYGLSVESARWFVNQYVERDVDGYHPYAFPLQARSLSDLPPAVVVTAGFDPLRDEAIAYVERLADAGVRISHHDYEGVVHGFFGLLTEPSVDCAREAVEAVASDLDGGVDY